MTVVDRLMVVQVVMQPGQMGHLAGDVPALFIVAAALAILTRRSRGTDDPLVPTGLDRSTT